MSTTHVLTGVCFFFVALAGMMKPTPEMQATRAKEIEQSRVEQENLKHKEQEILRIVEGYITKNKLKNFESTVHKKTNGTFQLYMNVVDPTLDLRLITKYKTYWHITSTSSRLIENEPYETLNRDPNPYTDKDAERVCSALSQYGVESVSISYVAPKTVVRDEKGTVINSWSLQGGRVDDCNWKTVLEKQKDGSSVIKRVKR